jgi:hypothetical protein
MPDVSHSKRAIVRDCCAKATLSLRSSASHHGCRRERCVWLQFTHRERQITELYAEAATIEDSAEMTRAIGMLDKVLFSGRREKVERPIRTDD